MIKYKKTIFSILILVIVLFNGCSQRLVVLDNVQAPDYIRISTKENIEKIRNNNKRLSEIKKEIKKYPFDKIPKKLINEYEKLFEEIEDAKGQKKITNKEFISDIINSIKGQPAELIDSNKVELFDYYYVIDFKYRKLDYNDKFSYISSIHIVNDKTIYFSKLVKNIGIQIYKIQNDKEIFRNIITRIESFLKENSN